MTPDTAVDLGSVTKIVVHHHRADDAAAARRTRTHRPARPVPRRTRAATGPGSASIRCCCTAPGSGSGGRFISTLTASTLRARSTSSKIAALELRYPVGQRRHYSDLGFLLLGAVVRPCDRRRSAGRGGRRTRVRAVVAVHHDRLRPPVGPGPVAASSVGDRIERRMVDDRAALPGSGRPADFAGWRERVLVGEVNDGNAFHALRRHGRARRSLLHRAGSVDFGTTLLTAWTAPARSVPDGDRDASSPRPGRRVSRAASGSRARRSATARRAVYGHPGFPGRQPSRSSRGTGPAWCWSTNRLHVDGWPRPHEPSVAIGPGRRAPRLPPVTLSSTRTQLRR